MHKSLVTIDFCNLFLIKYSILEQNHVGTVPYFVDQNTCASHSNYHTYTSVKCFIRDNEGKNDSLGTVSYCNDKSHCTSDWVLGVRY